MIDLQFFTGDIVRIKDRGSNWHSGKLGTLISGIDTYTSGKPDRQKFSTSFEVLLEDNSKAWFDVHDIELACEK